MLGPAAADAMTMGTFHSLVRASPNPNPNRNPDPNPDPNPHPHPNPNQVAVVEAALDDIDESERLLNAVWPRTPHPNPDSRPTPTLSLGSA